MIYFPLLSDFALINDHDRQVITYNLMVRWKFILSLASLRRQLLASAGGEIVNF